MVSFAFHDNEIVSSPLVIVNGTTKVNRGTIQFTNNANKVFPPQTFEVNEGQFKAYVHVSEGVNNFEVEVYANGVIDPYGFGAFNGKPKVSEKGHLVLNYKQLNNKPVHLCLIVAKDSTGTYDLPAYKRQRGEQANLQTAIKRLKVAARMMQAFTQDEMRRVGFSNRSFQFVEETVLHQGIFGYNVESPTPHQEVKVHVLRSPLTVAELRDPDIAQQNPKGKKTGELFGHANHLVLNTPEIFKTYKDGDTPIQAACIYLDSHYDAKLDMILTHAALGGGTNEVKLAIFGSHGLHSWPVNFAQITPSFLDATHLGKDVANDCGECGTSWECCNITMGAFMHEIGHSFGSPHQESGVMLRDYVWWNRSFMTRELESLKRNTRGDMIRRDGTWSNSCHWHDTDLMRYFYHDSFSIPGSINMAEPSTSTAQQTSQPSDHITEDEASLYDRQIRLWGLEAQNRMRSSTVCVLSLRSLAHETIKNLVLAGIGRLIVMDNGVVTEEDLGGGFLFREEEGAVGQERTAAALPQIASLNPLVSLTAIPTLAPFVRDAGEANAAGAQEDITEFLRKEKVDVVVACDLTIAEMTNIDAATRAAGCKFYAAGTYGFYGYVFADLGEQYQFVHQDPVSVTNPEPPVTKRSLSYPALSVALQREKWSIAQDVQNPSGSSYRGLTRSATRLVAPPTTIGILGVWEFQKQNGRLPGQPDDHDAFAKIVYELRESLGVNAKSFKDSTGEDLYETAIDHLSAHAIHFFPPTLAILGGFLAQDVLRALSQKDTPIANLLVVDTMGGTGTASRWAMNPAVEA